MAALMRNVSELGARLCPDLESKPSAGLVHVSIGLALSALAGPSCWRAVAQGRLPFLAPLLVIGAGLIWVGIQDRRMRFSVHERGIVLRRGRRTTVLSVSEIACVILTGGSSGILLVIEPKSGKERDRISIGPSRFDQGRVGEMIDRLAGEPRFGEIGRLFDRIDTGGSTVSLQFLEQHTRRGRR